MVKIQPLLFIDNKTSNYYLKEEQACDTCNEKMVEGDAFFLISEYSNNYKLHLLVCVTCARRYKQSGKITEFRQGFINRIIPSAVTPVILFKPSLTSYRGETTIEAATSKEHKGVIINDNTKLAIKDDNFIDKLIASTPTKKVKRKLLR